jgi:cobalamin biosynthesis protein CobW
LVVSGFLGSGKTTLVRRLLEQAQQEGARVAFVSNEMGELGVDQALLGGGEEAFVEIAGGCVCCALNDELYDTLIALRAQVDPDRIVVETSGVAIPHDVQITFYQPPIKDWISEEAVVTVVNAEQLQSGDNLDGTFTEQLETADLVVLHKVDLVEPEAISGLKADIDRRHPGVPVVTATHGGVDPRLLFAAEPMGRSPETTDLHAHDHADHAHLHDVFVSEVIEPSQGLSESEIFELFQGLGAVRIKGFVRIDGELHVVQGVGRRLEVEPVDDGVKPELVGRVVVIRRVDDALG